MLEINLYPINLFNWVGNTKCAEVLIKNGANIDTRDPYEETPAETAVTRGFDRNLSIYQKTHNE